MSAIIGFIPPDGICQDAEVTLPVGFLSTGERIEFNNDEFANCVLIFLDDTCDYNAYDHRDCFQGNGRDALLFQHKSNSIAWDIQQTWLSENGGNPRHFAGFSRTETEDEFMKATKKLLCNNDNCHAMIIEDLLQRIEGKYLFKLLDNYVAWEILSSLKEDDDTFDKRDDAFGLLPEYIKSKLPESPLTEVISTANKQAFDLIQ